MISSISDLKKFISNEKIKVCSFDVFDTLLIRPSVFPNDFFTLVGRKSNVPDFYGNIRTVSEKIARLNKLYSDDEIKFTCIFNQMQDKFQFSPKEIDLLKNNELEAEYQYIACRKAMKEVFLYAKQLGKIVILATDIFYPRAFVERLLQKCGLVGYDKLYVSAEYNLTKNTGRLYQQIIKDFEIKGIKKEEILHIGDNDFSDKIMAQRQGIHAESIKRVEVIANSDDTFKRLRRYSERFCDNTFLMGVSINMLYDDPYSGKVKKSFLEDEKAVNITLLAPLVFSYAKWVLDNCRARGIKRFVFAGEEGHLLERVMKSLLIYIYPKLEIMRMNFDSDLSALLNMKFPENVLVNIPDPKSTVKDFIATYLKSSDYDYYFDVFRKYGYYSYNMYIGDKKNYLPLLGELKVKFEGMKQILMEQNSKIVVPVLHGAAFYTNKYMKNVIAFKEITDFDVFTLFEMDTFTVSGLNFLVQYGRLYGRDLEKIKNQLIRIFDLDLPNRDRKSASIATDILNYTDEFCKTFGQDINLMNFNSYQYYEFIKIAFYEYPFFIMKQ